MAVMKDEEYLLLPCSGRAKLGIPRGHLYKAKDREGNELGFVTEETAREKFGEGNYFISGSDTLCPLCNLHMMGDLEINLIDSE